MVDNVTERMLTAVPSRHGCDLDTLRECIEAIQTVTQVTLACADARLAEQVVDELTNHERILLATAGVCETTAGVLSRGAGLDPVVVRAPHRLLDGMSSRPRGGRGVRAHPLPLPGVRVRPSLPLGRTGVPRAAGVPAVIAVSAPPSRGEHRDERTTEPAS